MGDPSRARRYAAVVFGVWVVVAATAAAQPPPQGYVVAVSAEPALDDTTARIGAAARAALRRQDVVEWQAADEKYLGYGPDVRRALEEARHQFDEGRAAYLNLQLDDAIAALGSALRGFDAAAAALEEPGYVGEALLYLGACQTFLERDRQARETFRRLHVQMPHIRPDPEDFGPEVVEAYERAAPSDAASPSSTLEIDSEPSGAVAYVDFRARGRTPVTVTGLVAGEHLVRVTRAGAPSEIQTAAVQTRRGNRVSASLTETTVSGRLTNLERSMATSSFEVMSPGSTTRIFADTLGVDMLGVIRVTSVSSDRVGLVLNLLDRETGEQVLSLSREVPTQVGVLEPSVEELVTTALSHAFDPNALAAGLSLEEGLGNGYGPGDDSDDPIYERWYFWAAVGGGVALVGGLVLILALTLGGSESDDGGQLILQF